MNAGTTQELPIVIGERVYQTFRDLPNHVNARLDDKGLAYTASYHETPQYGVNMPTIRVSSKGEGRHVASIQPRLFDVYGPRHLKALDDKAKMSAGDEFIDDDDFKEFEALEEVVLAIETQGVGVSYDDSIKAMFMNW